MKNRQLVAQTEHGMSVAEGAVWWLLLIPFSGGLLYPFYRGRLHKLRRTYSTYASTGRISQESQWRTSSHR